MTGLLQKIVDVRADEVRALLLGFAYFFCVLTAYYILRPLRDEMGIQGGVRNLPWLFTATFLTMLCAVPFYGKVVARFPRERFIPLVYRFFIANILIFWVLLTFEIGGVHVARVFFVWISVFNLFVVSVFWSFMADLFRTEQGKRLFGFIAAGGSAGALLGPSITLGLSAPLGPVNLLLISALILEIALFCVRGLSRSAAPTAETPRRVEEQPIGGGALAGLSLIVKSRYLSGIALWVFLLTVIGTFLYFQQANIVAAASNDPTQRTQIFAGIDLIAGILTILIQLAATGRLMTRFGVGPAAAVLPAIAIVGFIALAIAPMLAVIIIFQAVQRTANFAISNPAREILFTVLPREAKYKAKNVIDTLVFRGGDAVSGWGFAALQGIGFEIAAIALATAPIAGLWFVLSLALGHMQAARAKNPDAGDSR